jgi:hypothetical protein
MMPVAKETMIHVSTNVQRQCPICRDSGDLMGDDHFEQMCNHLLKHGLECLHVGQETHRTANGKPWQSTIAVFGK